MMMRKGCLLAFAFLTIASLASAAGFAVSGQSPSALGNAFTGGAAAIDDASSMYANPASISRFATPRISAGLQVVVPSVTFSANKAENSNGVMYHQAIFSSPW